MIVSSAPVVMPTSKYLAISLSTGFVRNGKVPMGKRTLRVAADVLRAICPQTLRRIMLRIEAHAQQLRIAPERGIGRQLPLDRREIVCHRGQKFGSGQRV